MSEGFDPDAFARWNRERSVDLIQRAEGASAIFVERPTVVYVRVSQVEVDDERVRVRITRVPTPGMGLPDGRNWYSCEIGAEWGALAVSTERWYARYIAWRLYFDQELIERILLLAKQRADEGKQLNCDDAFISIAQYRFAKFREGYGSKNAEDEPIGPIHPID